VTIALVILLGVLAWGMIAVVEIVRGHLNDDDADDNQQMALVIALSPEKKHDTKSHQTGSNSGGPTLP
jgi:hypothetical protein